MLRRPDASLLTYEGGYQGGNTLREGALTKPLPRRLAALCHGMQAEHVPNTAHGQGSITAAAALPGSQTSECLLLNGICKRT